MDHWSLHARQWALVGPPLRPCAADVAIATAELAAWTAAHRRAPRALLLGVTPELATLAWPAGTALTAIDRAPAMIGALFTATPDRRAVVADWRALPLRAAAIDVALGDGCLPNLAFPDGYRAFARELGRVLAPGGALVTRLFVSPPVREALGAVADALAAGAIGSFHAFKWRLAMAVAPDDRNVRVAAIWEAFAALVPDRAALARATGWPAAEIATIDAYRDSARVYAFPTLDETRAALGDALVETACRVPAYELGDRCPSLTLRAK
ncbi:MAG: class I SAM-dependent methyltransferase [Deltaproteobacteria bacterium]|nr:class I SAM-dependent methyltransferase [Deltaproteobacteria bacterium]